MRQSPAWVLLCAFCALAAAPGPGGASAGAGGTGIAAGYASRAGAVLGTYRPESPDRSPETVARAAARFLGSLDAVACGVSGILTMVSAIHTIDSLSLR